MPKPIWVEGRLLGERKSKSKSMRPVVPESLTRFRRERCLCIRVDRGMTSRTPLPDSRELKPPDLSAFLESKILKRVLAICRLARKEIFIVGKTLPLQNPWPRKGKPTAHQPPPSDRLEPFQGGSSISMDSRPENGNPRPSMPTTETVSSKCICFALQEASFLSH